jgi:uncharacterized protein YjiS (DUF1127 family)
MRFGSPMKFVFRRVMWWLERLVAAHREMQMLLRADERALKDVGLTPGDVSAVAQCDVMANAAAARRREAMATARHRRLSTAIIQAAGARTNSQNN